jgi:hypothetical protein
LRRSLGLPVGLIERTGEVRAEVTKRKHLSGSPKKKAASKIVAPARARTR